MFWLCVLLAAVGLSDVFAKPSAQATDRPDAPEDQVVLSKLAPPIYPRIAQSAHIQGEVNVTIGVRHDGGVESATFVGGHPMLKQAALDSAEQSLFECHGCSDGFTSYSLTYKFEIAPRDPPKDCFGNPDPPPPQPQVDLARHQVTVFAWQLWTCDPAVEIHRFRSAKCLYLWRCGVREKAVT